MSSTSPAEGDKAKGTTSMSAKKKSFNLWDAQPMITIKCGTREWSVHQNILTHGSEYFRKALSEPFKENHSKAIELDCTIIEPETMGYLISTMYQAAMNSKFKMSDENMPGSRWMKYRITLWIAAEYFQHEQIKKEAIESFKLLQRSQKGAGHSTFIQKDENQRKKLIQNFVDAWKACEGNEPAISIFRSPLTTAFAKTCCDEALDLLWEMAPGDMLKAISKQLQKLRK